MKTRDEEYASYMKSFRLLLDELLKLKAKKTWDYGVKTERSLGIKGLFTDINGKFLRLKHFVWDAPEDKPVVLDESLEDTYKDLAIYCLMSILLLREEKK